MINKITCPSEYEFSYYEFEPYIRNSVKPKIDNDIFSFYLGKS